MAFLEVVRRVPECEGVRVEDLQRVILPGFDLLCGEDCVRPLDRTVRPVVHVSLTGVCRGGPQSTKWETMIQEQLGIVVRAMARPARSIMEVVDAFRVEQHRVEFVPVAFAHPSVVVKEVELTADAELSVVTMLITHSISRWELTADCRLLCPLPRRGPSS